MGKPPTRPVSKALSEGHCRISSTVAWRNRPTIILFDARPNDSVQAARRQLGFQLQGWGADVRDASLPANDDRVNGPDDYLGLYGDHALWQVLDQARPIDFERDTRGRIVKDSLDNIRLAMRRLRVTLSYDEFAGVVMIDEREADEHAVNGLWLTIDDTFKFRPLKDTLNTLVDSEARKSPVHPVREYPRQVGVGWHA